MNKETEAAQEGSSADSNRSNNASKTITFTPDTASTSCHLNRFREAMEALGLEPPVGNRQSNRAGWCKLFDDGLGGCFGDGSSGLSESHRRPVTAHHAILKIDTWV